jgi:hypothetical protein
MSQGKASQEGGGTDGHSHLSAEELTSVASLVEVGNSANRYEEGPAGNHNIKDGPGQGKIRLIIFVTD